MFIVCHDIFLRSCLGNFPFADYSQCRESSLFPQLYLQNVSIWFLFCCTTINWHIVAECVCVYMISCIDPYAESHWFICFLKPLYTYSCFYCMWQMSNYYYTNSRKHNIQQMQSHSTYLTKCLTMDLYNTIFTSIARLRMWD